MRRTAKGVGLFCACLHVFGFTATLLCIRFSRDPQASLLWTPWAIIDFPVSLFYWLGGNTYSTWLGTFENSPVAQVLYLPHLIHGPVGTLWWYFLPSLLLPKKLGGVWGKRCPAIL